MGAPSRFPLAIVISYNGLEVATPEVQGTIGGSGWTRTTDSRGFNPELYQLSYRSIGGREGIRTPDPLLAKQTLSRAELHAHNGIQTREDHATLLKQSLCFAARDHYVLLSWSGAIGAPGLESNRQPAAYKAAALPLSYEG